MTDAARFLTQAAAALHFKVSKPLITRKKQQGKLVMKGGLVDVELSAGAFGGNGKQASSVNKAVNSEPRSENRGDFSNDKSQHAPAEKETFSNAQLRKEVALANLRELEHAEKSGELVNVPEMESAWAVIGQTLRDALLSLPERISPQLAALTDVRQVRDILRKEIRTVISNIPEQIRNVAADPKAA